MQQLFQLLSRTKCLLCNLQFFFCQMCQCPSCVFSRPTFTQSVCFFCQPDFISQHAKSAWNQPFAPPCCRATTVFPLIKALPGGFATFTFLNFVHWNVSWRLATAPFSSAQAEHLCRQRNNKFRPSQWCCVSPRSQEFHFNNRLTMKPWSCLSALAKDDVCIIFILSSVTHVPMLEVRPHKLYK